ncbi:hypothetical protein LSH36_448g01021 [Paralvinella palmiformis]|uniref:Activator of Hsp90 ATPase AHSA1-like N-terminal domain-containing protein n=1 Tax=Paralvinella palmiformis TaxID=53620 RepID=A0AAD9JB02_9ANNE|nr:hypothetical protein LSH36_448g01021 [Paralvinella palmiformis]
MAKWGEGDPRWIVEQRADGTNVNNWHWTEKNATGWSKEKLKALLEGLKLEDDTYSCEITEITKLEGEAVANNRKAKLIFFYEWDIKADWKGKIVGTDKVHNGKIEIPNLSEENNPQDIAVNVTANTDKDDAYKLKEFIRLHGTNIIQDMLGKYVIDLKEEFSKGMILPSGTPPKQTNSTQNLPQNVIKQELSKPVVSDKGKKSLGVKISCRKMTDRQTFKCRAGEIYRALTEKDMVRAFTRNDVTIEAEKGGQFVLFNGMVTGEFTELIPYEKIGMRWRNKSWPEGHYSQVSLTFDQKEDCTEMTLTQTGVPESDLESTEQGWNRYYWQSIKQTFGFGASLY